MAQDGKFLCFLSFDPWPTAFSTKLYTIPCPTGNALPNIVNSPLSQEVPPSPCHESWLSQRTGYPAPASSEGLVFWSPQDHRQGWHSLSCQCHSQSITSALRFVTCCCSTVTCSSTGQGLWKTLGSHFHPAPRILRGFSNHVNNQSIIVASLYHPHLGPSPGPQIYTSNCLPSSLSTPSHHMHPSFSLRCPLHFLPIAQACHFLSSLHAHYYFPPYYTYPLIFLPQLFPQPKSQRNKSICSPFLFLH